MSTFLSRRSLLTALLSTCLVGLLLLTALQISSGTALAKSNERAVANLQHTPSGTANLRISPNGHYLFVTITLLGLAPKSTHPAHIHAGVCTSNGPILYPLKNVVANKKGQASSTTALYSSTGWTIPATGWYVNVHNGPTLATPLQMEAIACGNISNPYGAKYALTFLGGTPDPNQNATGITLLKLHNHTLTVTVEVYGLAPKSAHMIHIHAGDCFYTKQVLYDLSPLVADGQGYARKVITIHGVNSIPESGWAINVHLTTDLSTQTGYDPILCGNIAHY